MHNYEPLQPHTPASLNTQINHDCECGCTPRQDNTNRVCEEVVETNAQEKRSADIAVREVPIGCLLVWGSAEDRRGSDTFAHNKTAFQLQLNNTLS